jgi:hypothetical protein
MRLGKNNIANQPVSLVHKAYINPQWIYTIFSIKVFYYYSGFSVDGARAFMRFNLNGNF